MFQVSERENYENGKWLEMLSAKVKEYKIYDCESRFLDLFNKLQITSLQLFHTP